MARAARCPLCASPSAGPSWLGTLRYAGRDYPYLECRTCHSLYADPMPDETALARMYGSRYGAVSNPHGVEDPKEPGRVIAWLRAQPAGTFVDYGCGDGRLLTQAGRIGWRAIGVEFDADVAAETARRTGVRVADRFTLSALLAEGPVDALHLGDVIEHLTNPDVEMDRILRLIRPGGYLLAQGPLEANPTLFTAALKLSRRLRRSAVSEMAPYHVVLATARGQRAFFDRFGLRPLEFHMQEVAWPAPSRLALSDVRQPRTVGLFALRRLSQALSAMRPGRWGNRYFYVGQRPAMIGTRT